jgi:ribosome biogenesis GTPase A
MIGNTNVGKSSTINAIVGFELLNTDIKRETSCRWKIKLSKDDTDKYSM